MAELSLDQEITLRKTLAYLFNSVPRSRLVLTDAGIPQRNISFSDSAADNWFMIIEEVKRQEMMVELVRVALTFYPKNEELQSLQAVLTGTQGNTTSPSDPSQPRDTPPPVTEDISSTITKIQRIITLDEDLSLALEHMLNLTREADALQRMENDVIALLGRWNSLKRQRDQGMLTSDEANRQTNVLRHAVLGTLERMETRLSF
ncbi:MAG: effector-associated domain EAD1-containing protein [Bacteroidota bacterium]